MSPPEFDSQGNLPVGVHRASLDEVIARFGHGSSQRQLVTTRLIRVYELANNTSKLKRFICVVEARPLFDHLHAQQEFGASVFAIRPSQILLETVDSFIIHWQLRRDQGRRGIVEVV